MTGETSSMIFGSLAYILNVVVNYVEADVTDWSMQNLYATIIFFFPSGKPSYCNN